MTKRTTSLLAAIATATLAAHALAQHRVDCILSLSPGLDVAPSSPQRMLTAFFESPSDTNPTPTRVFESTLGSVSPSFTDTPGFDSSPSVFPVNSSNGFNILKALRKWNGNGFDVLSGPTAEHIQVTYGPFGPVQSPDCDALTPGFTVAVTSNGEWHRHLEYFLTDPARTGVYLLELVIFSTSTNPTIAETKPIWFVFQQSNENDDPPIDPAVLQAQHDAASAWVTAHLVPQLCPADFNADGSVTVQDIFTFLTAWFAHSTSADFNGDCAVTVQDIFSFLTAWFAKCPS